MLFTIGSVIWQQDLHVGFVFGYAYIAASVPSQTSLVADWHSHHFSNTMSSSFYIDSLIQVSKAKSATTTTSDSRHHHAYESPVPCSCCWSPTQPEPNSLCQLCIPSSPAVHPFMHVRGASIPGGALYSRELTTKDHLLLQRYPSSEDERVHLASYGKHSSRCMIFL